MTYPPDDCDHVYKCMKCHRWKPDPEQLEFDLPALPEPEDVPDASL